MKQEYVLLRKENDLLNSLIGQSFNQKTKFESYKILKEIHSKAQDRSIGKMALCYIVDKNEVLGVGGSSLMKNKKTGKIVSNLILDNFGEWLGAIFKTTITGNRSTTLITEVGGSEFVQEYGGTLFNNGGTGFGSTLQVGSGSTPPARTDFFVETPFGTAPENFRFAGISNPVYNSGLGNFKLSATINAGGAGTINESILMMQWDNTSSALKTFTLFRDIISPAQSFIVGKTIALEYTIQL